MILFIDINVKFHKIQEAMTSFFFLSDQICIY